MALIAPSMLSCNFLNLESEIEMINNSEADMFHLDVMDGRFVPNISFGMPIISTMKKVAKKPFDVHLMIEEPEKYFDAFAKAGADSLTIHYETSKHLHRNLQIIRSLGMKTGVALNPHTSVSLLDNVIYDIDMICIMAVNPGFSGQKFIYSTINKLINIKIKTDCLIQIDGGVTLENAKLLIDLGADVLVAGSAVFDSANPTETIKKLKSI